MIVAECWLVRGMSVLYRVSLMMTASLNYLRRKRVAILGCFRKTNCGWGHRFKPYLCKTDNLEI